MLVYTRCHLYFLHYSISGKPLIVNYNDLQISVKVARSTSSILTFTVAAYLNGADFDGLVKAIAGNEAVSLKWLTKLKAGKNIIFIHFNSFVSFIQSLIFPLIFH